MLGPHTPPVLISPLSSPLPGNARETSRFVATLLSVSLTRPQKHYLRAEKWRERADFEEFQGISRGAPELWERGVYRGWTINEFAFSNGHCAVYRAGNTRNTVAIMNENLMIHYAHRVEWYFVNIEALDEALGKI